MCRRESTRKFEMKKMQSHYQELAHNIASTTFFTKHVNEAENEGLDYDTKNVKAEIN